MSSLHSFAQKGAEFRWVIQCQQAFDKIKEYLAHPSVLMPPILGCSMILYISITAIAAGALLGKLDDEGKEIAIYYINCTLVGYEINYSPMEKTCLAVIFCSQKLRHYMLSHTVKLIYKIDPPKYLLSKTTLIGRMAKWIILLK